MNKCLFWLPFAIQKGINSPGLFYFVEKIPTADELCPMASFFRAQVFSLLRQDDGDVLKKGTFAFKLKFYINKFCFKKSHNKNILA